MQTASAAFVTMVEGNDLIVENQLTIALPIVRTNLWPSPQGAAADLWSGNPGNTYAPIGPGYSGQATMMAVTLAPLFVTVSTPPTAYAYITIPTSPGLQYTVQAVIQFNNGSLPGLNCAVGLRDGSAVGTSVTHDTHVPATSTLTFTATGPLTDIGVIVTGTGQTLGTGGAPQRSQLLIGEMMVEQSATVGSFFDGNTAGASWSGTPGDSQSCLNVSPYPDMTLTVESIEIDRSMTTDAPQATRMIQGYPAASANIVLSGLVDQTDESKSAVWLFNPNEPTSPLYRHDALGSAITIAAGLYVGNSASAELIRMFTGSIDEYVVDPYAGTVTITGIDDRNVLRSLPDFATTVTNPYPMMLILYGATPNGNLYSTLVDQGLTATWVLDSLLRANDIYASPDRRPSCALYASMAGGMFPQLYNTKSVITPQCTPTVGPDAANSFVEGYWVKQVPANCSMIIPTVPGVITIGAPAQGVGGWYFECALNAVTPPVYASDGFNPPVEWAIQIEVAYEQSPYGLGFTGDGINIQPVYTATGQPVPNQWTAHFNGGTIANFTMQMDQWHMIGLQANYTPGSTTYSYTLYVDGVAAATGTSPNGTLTPVGATYGYFSSYYPAESVQFTGETSAVPRTLAGFTPDAYLDASLNPLHACPDISASDCWTVIQNLASAEYGLCGFDELGIFRFQNRKTLAGTQAVRSITSTASLESMQEDITAAASINRVQVPINAVTLTPFEQIYTGPDPSTAITLPAKTSQGESLQLNDQITGLSCAVWNGNYPPPQPDGGTTSVVAPGYQGSGFRADKLLTGLGAQVLNCAMTVYQDGPSSFTWLITNPNNFPVYLVTPTGAGYAAGDVGTPFFSIGGVIVQFGQSGGAPGVSQTATTGVGAASGTSDPTSAPSLPPANAQYVVNGAQQSALAVPANDWIQDPDAAQSLAEDLLEDLIYPRPQIQGLTIVADPRIQLGDRVTIYDPDCSMMNSDVILVGITTTISKSEWSQSVDARAVSAPGYWVLDTAGQSEMGATTWI